MAHTNLKAHIEQGLPGAIRDLGWSPSGSHLAVARLAIMDPRDLGEVTIFDWNRRQPVLKLLQSHRITTVLYSPAGNRILTLNHDGSLKLWSADAGREAFTLNGVTCATFSPDGARIAIGCEDRTIKILDGK